jgi:adenylate cyclase
MRKTAGRAPLRKLVAGLSIGAASAAAVLLLGYFGWLEKAELWTYDWRLQQVADPASISKDIVLVQIDDTTLRDIVPVAGRWPWPRVLHSLLINYLKRGPARVVAMDIGFSEPEREAQYLVNGRPITGAQSDGAFVEAVRAAGNVILLADAVSPGSTGAAATAAATWRAPNYRLGPAIEQRRQILPPHQALADAALGFGHNFLAFDVDGRARRIPPFVRQGDKYMPSLGIAAALAAGGFKPEEVVLDGDGIRVRDRRIPLVPVPVRDVSDPTIVHQQQTMLINYRAPALVDGKSPFQSFELRNLLKSEGLLLEGQPPPVDPALFRDKVVFVGLNAAGWVDAFSTPFGSSGAGVMPGIQLHASMADSLLTNRFIALAPDWSRLMSATAGAVGVGLMATFLPFAAAAAGTILAIGGWVALTTWALGSGTWFNMMQPISAGALALFVGTAYRYFVEDREKRKVSKLFGRYVSRDVYDRLLADPSLAVLGGGRRELTVLFSDIRGFTAVTERGDPEELVSQLNEYFSRMVEIVFRHRGTVDKFVGDMVMALFGAPVDDVDHAEHAVAAATDMVAELGELNRKWAGEGRAQLDIGIGVNSGEMIAGNIGSSSIMSYTVIGDNVNLGARLESLNKDFGCRIIISEATRSRLKRHYELRSLGEVVVKGKTKPVAIFEVQAASPLHATAKEAQL